MNTFIHSWIIINKETLNRVNYTDNVSPMFRTSHDLSRDMTITVLPVTLLIAFESVFGMIGNMFILIVYYKWYKMCNFRYFVLFMACIDLTSCITTLPGEIVSQINWYSYPYEELCKVKSFFNVFTVLSSGLVLLLLAYDRYRKICYPLSWQVPVHISMRLCSGSIILALVVSSPTAVFWGQQSYDYVDGNASISVTICEKADSYADGLSPFVYMLCALVTPMAFIMIITVTFNVQTGKKLFRSLGRERKHYEAGNGDNERSFRLSSREHINGEDQRQRCPTRRYSFPEGKLSLKRRMMRDKSNHFRLNSRHLDDIPEYSSSFMYKLNQAHVEVLPKRDERRNSKTHVSVSDVGNPRTSIIRLDEWRRNRYQRTRLSSRRRKTVIMLVLSGVFIVTMTLYLGLLCMVANKEGLLRELTNSQKVVFFFFWRLYFVNSLINPILYGFMDHRFRRGLVRIFCSKDHILRTSVF